MHLVLEIFDWKAIFGLDNTAAGQLLPWLVKIFCVYNFFKKMRNINPFRGATNTPVLNFS